MANKVLSTVATDTEYIVKVHLDTTKVDSHNDPLPEYILEWSGSVEISRSANNAALEAAVTAAVNALSSKQAVLVANGSAISTG